MNKHNYVHKFWFAVFLVAAVWGTAWIVRDTDDAIYQSFFKARGMNVTKEEVLAVWRKHDGVCE